MATTTILSDNGVSSGSAGIKTTGGNDGVLALQTTTSGGTATTAVTIDTSQNVGIGTATPSNAKLNAIGADTAPQLNLYGSSSGALGANFTYKSASGDLNIATNGFNSSSAPQVVLSASGNLLVGVTATPSGSIGGAGFIRESVGRSTLYCASTTTGSTGLVNFYNPNGNVGYIATSGSATSYVTSSDYRLKNTVAPMTGALAKVAALKPCTYKWNSDNSDGEGFIAHELAEVVPQCVTGEKDAVDADGNPVYQGIDTSFLVATLTAAIQELKAEIDSLKSQLNGA